MKTLVMGVPGSGKTTYCKRNLAGGIVYDMDWLSAAFCYEEPRPENFDFTGIHQEAARKISSALLPWFVENAEKYTERIFIIRTAPSIPEMEMIGPDRIVICKRPQAGRNLSQASIDRKIERLLMAEEWARDHGIPIEEQFNGPRRMLW